MSILDSSKESKEENKIILRLRLCRSLFVAYLHGFEKRSYGPKGMQFDFVFGEIIIQHITFTRGPAD